MLVAGPRREVRKNALDHSGHFACPLGGRFGHLVHDGRIHSHSPVSANNEERRANMDEDVLKEKWNEIEWGAKRSGANSPMKTSPQWKEKREALGVIAAEIWISQGQSRAGIQGFHRPRQGEVRVLPLTTTW